MLSDEERANLNLAMNRLKQKYIDNTTIWDLHTLIHYPDSAPGAHWGPAFLPWHREFLRQFETALQAEVPGRVPIIRTPLKIESLHFDSCKLTNFSPVFEKNL